MKWKKPSEQQKFQNYKAGYYAFGFYTAVLLIWSIYDLVNTGETGLVQPIFSLGTVIYVIISTSGRRKSEK